MHKIIALPKKSLEKRLQDLEEAVSELLNMILEKPNESTKG